MSKSLLPQSVKNLYHASKAIIAQIWFGFPARKLKIIAVTGTDGKTTTSTLIYHLLNQSKIKAALISTVAAYIGRHQIDTGLHVTSPDPWNLQKLLRKIVNQKHTHLVLEATSHGIDQHRLLGINPAITVLTNITHEHLDYHRSFAHYRNTKKKLLNRSKLVFLNPYDKNYSYLKSSLNSDIKIKPYSLARLPSQIARSIKQTFPQKYNQQNAAAAAQVALALKLQPKTIVQGFSSFSGIPGRLEPIPNSLGLNLFIDFAHTPNALKNVLTYLKNFNSQRLIAVFGAAGLRDKSKRPLMGAIASQLCDEVILTAEDPRTENPRSIINQILSGVTKNFGHIHSLPDRQQAINFALQLAQKGDTIAILGKGHEKSMCYGQEEKPWSDKKAVLKAIKLRSNEN